ncbi:hypothetical protein [Rhodoblastus sp.]
MKFKLRDWTSLQQLARRGAAAGLPARKNCVKKKRESTTERKIC